jgi:hypothetical protein
MIGVVVSKSPSFESFCILYLHVSLERQYGKANHRKASALANGSDWQTHVKVAKTKLEERLKDVWLEIEMCSESYRSFKSTIATTIYGSGLVPLCAVAAYQGFMGQAPSVSAELTQLFVTTGVGAIANVYVHKDRSYTGFVEECVMSAVGIGFTTGIAYGLGAIAKSALEK